MLRRTQPAIPKLRLDKVSEDNKVPQTARDSLLRTNVLKILTKRGVGNTARNTARTSGMPSQRSERFISTLKKPILLKEVDEEQWLELTMGNGGTFQERMDFCNNMYLALKKNKIIWLLKVY